MKINFDIIKNDIRWKECTFITKRLVRKIIRNILYRFDSLKKIRTSEIAIFLTNDDQMQAFNSQFRNIEKATNVLSFPSVQLDWRRLVEFVPSDMSGYYFLGDIAFGYEIIHAEALNCGISVQDHFMHLLVHAILHLIGFDHQDEEEAEVMEELEISILKDFGVNSPY